MRVFRALSVCLLAIIVLAQLASAQTLEDKVKEFELENGMRFVVVERHEAPVVFCAVAFDVGAIYERPGITGISHLLEHMLFKGTETIGITDYRKEISYLEEEDRLAEEARAILLEIGLWRMEFFDEYATELLASLSEEDRSVIGTDRALELEPKDREALFNLAVLLATRKPPEMEEARRLYRQARRLGSAGDPGLDDFFGIEVKTE